MSTNMTAYMMKPTFFPVGRSTTNQEVISMISGAIQTSEVEAYLEFVGSSIRFLDFEDISLIDTCVSAIEKVLRENDFQRDELDGIIYSSIKKANHEPATASSIALELGLPKLKVLDVTNACSGMANAVEVAAGWIAINPEINNIVLVAVELPFKYIDWHIDTPEDLKLKGSGLTVGGSASALIISRNKPREGAKITRFFSYDDAKYSDICKVPINGHFFSDSAKLHKPTIISLKKTRDVMGEIPQNTWIIPHQPSCQILQFARVFNTDENRVIITHPLYGNTVTSGWVSAYDHLFKTRFDEVKSGDPVIFKTMAGGFSSISIIGEFIKE
jgi:3-oxoacyl-[acyl-carrier-protein] synthase III